ncbi:zinc-binding dehydrogenase [Stackebrandtia nassauensis]|uniref:Alcohol dehydrogenase zinc-binding domain protein n=1 Tax=Stackebrandtia nassauensis (strain DSM 44728 / CIP 108903 / NRRL B-16338 / NBRC 102104 / LLR-40K-21) TaxID=446470 RepID=D3PTX8_STANL|nr:zinc-binding dehydrogenase [Stackebrandtia nassauensis]ADD39736.1 Alcohol dehydrogenase zinc-binding domain protein [Stackebrandtia nassauensis DSM 44728]
MRAIRQYEFGPAENLLYEELPDPVPGPGQLRIAVEAAGVHLLDAAIRSGDAGSHPFGNPELPMTPGREVAGTVDALGPDVDESWLGRRVVAHLGIASGGYAELAVREAEAVHPIPDGLSSEAAVAMIGTGRTAVGVLDVAAPTADDVAVVLAAAGGIGSLLVQALRASGATVVGAAGGEAKTRLVRGLAGGVIAVDYTEPGWPKRVTEALAGRQPTVVFDGVGGDNGRAALELLGVGGRFVMFGWSAGEITELSGQDIVDRGLSVTSALGPRMLSRPGGLRGLEIEALAKVADGTMSPPVRTFPLKDASGAHEALVNRDTVGKVVLVP